MSLNLIEFKINHWGVYANELCKWAGQIRLANPTAQINEMTDKNQNKKKTGYDLLICIETPG